jgi:hypothetical protein
LSLVTAQVQKKVFGKVFILEHDFHSTQYAAMGDQANSSNAVRLLNFSVEHWLSDK